MKLPRLEHKSIRQLKRSLDSRVFAIPRLQREFVWNGPKAAALLDSIYRGMPIGSIMTWNTGRENQDLLRPSLHILPPFNPANKTIRYLIDGQQRLSVIHQAFAGEQKSNSAGQVVDFSRVCFRLSRSEEEEDPTWFTYRKPIDKEFVSVQDILATNWSWRLKHLGKVRLRKIRECRDRLFSYRLPMIVLTTNDLAEVRQAFIRINSQGMRIGSADRAFARASTIDLRDKAKDIRDHLPEDFKGIDYETVLLGFSFVTQVEQVDVGERALESMIRWWEKRIEKDSSKQSHFLKQWSKYRKAFTKAIDYLRTNFAVLNKAFLPSVNMVATLAVFFFDHLGQPNGPQRAEIKKWFWATGVGQRYSGRGYRQNITADVAFFRKLASGRTARFSVETQADRVDVLRAEYNQSAALSKAFLCLLARQKPRYLSNGEPVPLTNEAARANRNDQHHIFPQALMKSYVRHQDYNSLCNICFVVAQENQSIGSKSPRSYLAEFRGKRFFARAMRSHLIPFGSDSGLWDKGVENAFRKFRQRRLAVICRAFEQEAGTALFRKSKA